MFPISRVFAARRSARSQLSSRAFGWNLSLRRAWNWGETMALVAIAIVIYIAARLALAAPAVIHDPVISPSPEYLLFYAAFSISRMLAAYLLSILFTLL